MKRSRGPRSAFARAAVVLAAVVFASCLEDSSGPQIPRQGYLALMPTFETELAGIVPLAEARITLHRIEDDSLVVDSIVPIQPGDTAVDLSVSVVVLSSNQEFILNVYLITAAGDTAFRGGPITVTPSANPSPF